MEKKKGSVVCSGTKKEEGRFAWAKCFRGKYAHLPTGERDNGSQEIEGNSCQRKKINHHHVTNSNTSGQLHWNCGEGSF